MRICSRCKDQIKRGHRYHIVTSRLLGFLWFLKRPEHYSCVNPTNGPKPIRLRGEVPLPFPEPDVFPGMSGTPISTEPFHPYPLETEIVYVNSQTGQISHPSPCQELADLN
jgi:hypothetical protein